MYVKTPNEIRADRVRINPFFPTVSTIALTIGIRMIVVIGISVTKFLAPM